jgi:outer membrane receptor for ferrienterochelin and colicin
MFNAIINKHADLNGGFVNMRRCFHKLLFLMLVSTLMNSICFAAGAPDQESLYTLGEVVVSATNKGVEAKGTTREISAEQISTNGAKTLNEALMLFPGLNIRTGGDGVPRIDLRGMKTSWEKPEIREN